MEGLARKAAQIAGLGPLASDGRERVNPTVFARKEANTDAAEILGRVEEPGPKKRPAVWRS
jgi:hypothetical protein